MSERASRRVVPWERRRPAGILRRPLRSKERTVSERASRRVVPWERRRPAGILRRPLRSKERTVSERARTIITGHPAPVKSRGFSNFFLTLFSS